MTAFDMDYLVNPHVQNGQENLTILLNQLGIPYGTYLWDPPLQGLGRLHLGLPMRPKVNGEWAE